MSNSVDDIIEDKSQIKFSNNLGVSSLKSSTSYSTTNVTSSGLNINSKKATASANVFDDENDLLSDMSFPHIENMSPVK